MGFRKNLGIAVNTVESLEKETNYPSDAVSRLFEIFMNDSDIIKKQDIISV